MHDIYLRSGLKTGKACEDAMRVGVAGENRMHSVIVWAVLLSNIDGLL